MPKMILAVDAGGAVAAFSPNKLDGKKDGDLLHLATALAAAATSGAITGDQMADAAKVLGFDTADL
jgi:hypothetical protein